ncbi:class I SAM-dependent methyltransferase [Azonexus sp.]|uniref:class I SAM-dependent methyltransferase n=1 Tax=Azonexus sp. TaxID=1872668 RepID=UPI0039E3BDEF
MTAPPTALLRVQISAQTPEYAAAAEALRRTLADDLAALPARAAVLDIGAGADFALADFALEFTPDGLQLRALAEGAPGPLRVDFIGGAAGHRRQFGGGSGQMIARAAGLQAGVRPHILDATAGLGGDAFVLAQLGCPLTLIERHPIIAALLADGLARAAHHPETAASSARMQLRQGNACALMREWTQDAPQVIYLDPMFPHRNKSALVKKEMRLLRPLVGDDDDAPELLAAALALASHRVVVKRPRPAPAIAGPAPSHRLEGKSSRYDIYAKKSLAEKTR